MAGDNAFSISPWWNLRCYGIGGSVVFGFGSMGYRLGAVVGVVWATVAAAAGASVLGARARRARGAAYGPIVVLIHAQYGHAQYGTGVDMGVGLCAYWSGSRRGGGT